MDGSEDDDIGVHTFYFQPWEDLAEPVGSTLSFKIYSTQTDPHQNKMRGIKSKTAV
jgi:hypothetical protein